VTAAPWVARVPAPHRVTIFSPHAIQHGLHTSINWTSWVITAYSVGLVFALSLAGKLTERFGRRRFFLASVVVFAGASLYCGLAGNIYLLIVLRAIQAASWRGIFFVNVPIGILLIICCLRYMPCDPGRDGHERRPLELAGMVLLGIGALALTLGISYLGEAGASAASPWFVVPVIAGLLGLALFGRHIAVSRTPSSHRASSRDAASGPSM
jgi:MFS family permease